MINNGLDEEIMVPALKLMGAIIESK